METILIVEIGEVAGRQLVKVRAGAGIPHAGRKLIREIRRRVAVRFYKPCPQETPVLSKYRAAFSTIGTLFFNREIA